MAMMNKLSAMTVYQVQVLRNGPFDNSDPDGGDSGPDGGEAQNCAMQVSGALGCIMSVDDLILELLQCLSAVILSSDVILNTLCLCCELKFLL